MFRTLCIVGCLLVALPAWAQDGKGYYRFPTIHGETVVFAAEGDLWRVPVTGGRAQRLTTHPGEETAPIISPDGRTVAFSGTYEGGTELYTMPLAGGLPTRWTYDGDAATATAWTPDGRLVYSTRHYATLPDPQLVAIDLADGTRERIPLAEATEATYDATGDTLFFVRPSFHGNVTKRYRGGTARKIWRFTTGTAEAETLTPDYVGESHSPVWWDDRVYFVTDRDGTMNLWSMEEAGTGLRQHTRHAGWDVRDPAVSTGRLVYQVGADLWLYDVATGREQRLDITLSSDFDQLREKWEDDPMDYLTSAHLSPDGDAVVLTARGRVAVAPTGQGRFVHASRAAGVRYRDAVFMPDGETLLVLTDATGELEFGTIPADGLSAPEPLTDDGRMLRFEGHPSPDAQWIAYTDNNQDLWLLEVETREQTVISGNRQGVGDLAWSADSRWLAYSMTAANTYTQIFLHSIETGTSTAVTSNRVNSSDTAWSPDGDWLYFLSDRSLRSTVPGPWGPRQPEPYFTRTMKIYQLALREGLRSPFKPADELQDAEDTDADDEETPDEEDAEGDPETDGHDDGESEQDDDGDDTDDDDDDVEPVEIDLNGIERRLWEVPAPAGNYSALAVNERALFWLSRGESSTDLMAMAIDHDDPEPDDIVSRVSSLFELSQDGRKALVRRGNDLLVFDARPRSPGDLDDLEIDLDAWAFPIDVREDWRQIFVDAWRLERDYFYDPGMHGVDWEAVRDQYLPLVDRVTTRNELSDLIGHVIGELSALHTSVRGGDQRQGRERVTVASLGARLLRDPAAGGYRIDYIYQADPDYPTERAPLADPSLGIEVGDIISAVNGVDTLSVDHLGALLRNRRGEQVRLQVTSAATGESRPLIVVPTANEANLRYSDWEYTRRMRVEEQGAGQVGYVHLRAMGGGDLTAWYEQFYPVFDRAGLILDVRHNRGGNIDSILLEKLMRRAWFYFQQREKAPSWNMQYAFRGHMVVLVDEDTASDGEAFADGFRRLGLGEIIGVRTWGGEIWLSSVNRLSDNGLARAPMLGVYGPEREWLIENHGVEPDIVVENPPHATFSGEDAQLDAAVRYLLDKIAEDPRAVPEPPPFPDKSFRCPATTTSGQGAAAGR